MKLITWNIQWGLGIDGRLDLARIVADARRIADFDVLCLQEVADNFPELKQSRGENQFAEIAELLPGYTAVEGAAVDIPDGQGRRKRFGNMVLSRLPVGRVLRHAAPWEADGGRSMPRLVLEAVVHAPFGPVRVMTTHLEFYSDVQRAAQVETIRDARRAAAARAGNPPRSANGPFSPDAQTRSAILTGDFNMTPDEPILRRLLDPFKAGAPAFRDAWTVLNGDAPHPLSFCIFEQIHKPPHTSDYIMLTEDLAPRLARVHYDVETQVSDHQPVLVELGDD